MVIRAQQLEALSEYMLGNFVSRMLAYVRSRFAEQTRDASDEDLRRTIQAEMERAESYGITDEADVQRYLEYVISYGADFDSSEWAGPILRQSASGTAKMNELDDANVCRLTGGERA